MRPNPVGWFEIYVEDMPRAKKFYETVMETRLDRMGSGPEMEMWTFPMNAEATGAGGALVRMPDYPPGGNSTMVYFSCEDCAVEESRITANGGRVDRPKESIGEYGFITIARDTEGNMFGLHSMK